MGNVCEGIKLPPQRAKFTSCNGKAWSNKFLKWHLEKAIQDENYEWAAECRNELERRKDIK